MRPKKHMPSGDDSVSPGPGPLWPSWRAGSTRWQWVFSAARLRTYRTSPSASCSWDVLEPSGTPDTPFRHTIWKYMYVYIYICGTYIYMWHIYIYVLYIHMYIYIHIHICGICSDILSVHSDIRSGIYSGMSSGPVIWRVLWARRSCAFVRPPMWGPRPR